MKNMSLKSLPIITTVARHLNRFGLLFFCLLLALVYSFVSFRIITLNNVKPDDSQVASEVKAAAVPHIDPTALKQIQALQDNSVSIQTLFNQARNNPFQE